MSVDVRMDDISPTTTPTMTTTTTTTTSVLLSGGATREEWEPDLRYVKQHDEVNHLRLECIDANYDSELLQELRVLWNMKSTRSWNTLEIGYWTWRDDLQLELQTMLLFPLCFKEIRLHDFDCDVPSFWYALGQGIANASPHLQKLSLVNVGPRLSSIKAMEHFANGLKDSLSYLQEIDLAHIKFEPDAIRVFGRAIQMYCPHLHTLTMYKCQLTDDDICNLLDCQIDALNKINLFSNICRSKGLSSLARHLQRPTCQLTSLGLRYQYPHVRNNGDVMDLSIFCQALQQNTTLLELDLSFNRLNDDHMEVLGLAISNTTLCCLQNLNLSGNLITDKGGLILAQHLQNNNNNNVCNKNSSIRYLNLDQNPHLHDWNIFIPAVEANWNLLEIAPWTLQRTAAKNLIVTKSLDLNLGGRHILTNNHTKDNNITNYSLNHHGVVPDGVWPYLLERVNCRISKFRNDTARSVNVLYYLLRQRSDLLRPRPSSS